MPSQPNLSKGYSGKYESLYMQEISQKRSRYKHKMHKKDTEKNSHIE